MSSKVVDIKMSEDMAIRIYPDSTKEMKEILEFNFGKALFSMKISDRVRGYEDICKILGVSSDDSKIKVEVEGFDDREIEVAKYLIKMMRISKVYRNGWIPKRGEKRFYAWANLSGSGFDFVDTSYDVAGASTASASRLCFRTAEDAKDAFLKCTEIYKGFIDLQ